MADGETVTAVVADTHAVVWYVDASPRLSALARTAMSSAILTGEPVYVSAVSMVEIAYLCEKRRVPIDLFDRMVEVLRRVDSGLVLAPLDLDVAEAIRRVPAALVPDMPDRMIAATAVRLNLPLVTAGQHIRAALTNTIW
jgi:PIN domain nuclease of toxin-antitoxin system